MLDRILPALAPLHAAVSFETERAEVWLLASQLGLNHLADWSHDEFKRHALGYRAELRKNNNRFVALLLDEGTTHAAAQLHC